MSESDNPPQGKTMQEYAAQTTQASRLQADLEKALHDRAEKTRQADCAAVENE